MKVIMLIYAITVIPFCYASDHYLVENTGNQQKTVDILTETNSFTACNIANQADKTNAEDVTGSHFFPLYGIILGKTTVKELARIGTRAKNINSTTNEPYNYYSVNGIQIWFTDSIASDIMMNSYRDDIPGQWKESGFDWKLSYTDWLLLLEKLRFKVDITKEPISKIFNGKKVLFAEITSTLKIENDLSMKFVFNFEYGKSDSVDGAETLYRISVSKLKESSDY